MKMIKRLSNAIPVPYRAEDEIPNDSRTVIFVFKANESGVIVSSARYYDHNFKCWKVAATHQIPSKPRDNVTTIWMECHFLTMN